MRLRSCAKSVQMLLQTAGALLLILGGGAAAAGDRVVNTSVARKIDVSSNQVKVETTYTVVGASTSYQFLIPSAQHKRLAYLEVTADGQEVPFELQQQTEWFAHYEAWLPQDAKEPLELQVWAVFTDLLEAYPKEILQTENQYMRYRDSVYVPSPYDTESQTTEVLLAEASPKGYHTGEEPFRVVGSTVIYGPYEGLTPEQVLSPAAPQLSVHYVNHAAFAKASTCLREIEVSHWGNIAVEELYEVEHHGAKLKGGFSRVDHKAQMVGRGKSTGPAFRRLIAEIPNSARDMYYRDNIGNISTSSVFQSRTGGGAKLLVLDTRYPMYGGWKTAWYQGYTLPSEEGLRVDLSTGEYTLNMDFGVPIEELWVEDLTIKVILPEGATDVRAVVPFEVEESRTRRFTFLDTPLMGGRPVIIMRKRNVVSEHNVKFQVHYKFSRPLMLHEPLLLVMACFLFFVLSIGAVRLFDTNGSRDRHGSKAD